MLISLFTVLKMRLQSVAAVEYHVAVVAREEPNPPTNELSILYSIDCSKNRLLTDFHHDGARGLTSFPSKQIAYRTS